MANLNFYINKVVKENNPYPADINIEVTIDISKYFDKKDFCREGYTFVAPSGREFHYGYTIKSFVPLIGGTSVWFEANSTKVKDDYYNADITSLAEDINAFYEYLEREKNKCFLRLSLRDIIPSNFKEVTLPDFISSNNILFYYDTQPEISPVIARNQVWFNEPELTDEIDPDMDVNEILKGFEEYKTFLKGYFAAKAKSNE